MKWLHPLRDQAGATLVEVLVAIAITGIMLPALATALVSSHAGRPTSTQQLQAASLLREATEAVRTIRERSWVEVATDGTYHPVISGNVWSLASGSETVNGFTRRIDISDAQRNGTGGIVTSGGVVDPSTKHVTVIISWTSPSNAAISSESYLTRWQNDAAWTQTTVADFTGGNLSNTVTTSTDDGEVQLADSPTTWKLSSILTSLKISTGLAANDVFVSGSYAYVGYSTGLAIVNISNPAAPVLTGTFRTFSVHVLGVYVSGNIAYLATDNSVGQLEMVDVSNPAAPTLAGAFQLLDNAEVAATSVYVRGTTAYVCKKQVATGSPGTNYGEFNIVNVANPALPSLIGSLNIGADCNNLAVSGTTAYLATSSAGQELTVVDISDEANPVTIHTTNLGAEGSDVAVSGSNLYMGSRNNAGGPEFRTYDISSPGTPTALGSYEIGADLNGIAVLGSSVQLATSRSGKQFTALDVTAPGSPTLISSVGLANDANNLFSFGNYSYLANGDSTKGLTIIYGGFRPTGTFESSSFDATNSTTTAGFNYLKFVADVPISSTLKFQVATNIDNATWNYVGPDGTNATFYNASGMVPLTSAIGRYFRYKASFTPSSDGQQTPVLSSVTLNYVP